MHELLRQVRFSLNPFLDAPTGGDNSYCAKPCGEGLAVYLELWITIRGAVKEQSGFVMNVVDIDRLLRQRAVEYFGAFISEKWRRGEHVSLADKPVGHFPKSSPMLR